VGKGRVLHRHDDVAALEATLLDDHGSVVATATALVIPLATAPSAV
jgi:hypothetical protein